MRHYLYIYYLLSILSIKRTTQGQTGAFLFTLGKFVRFAMFFVFIYFLVTQSSLLKGYTASQALIILMTFELVNSVSGLLFREVYRFRPLVVSGGLDGVLVKPIHPFMLVLLGGLDILDAFVLAIQVIIISYLIIGTYSWSGILLFIFLFVNATIIMAAFHILALSIGVLTTTVDQIMMILRDVSESGRFPIEIYKQPFRFVITFIIPIGVMMTFPAKGLFGMLSIGGVVAPFAVGVLFLAGNMWLWKFALRRYQSWGG
ncbi:hypothetical protein A3F32_02875 [Candidatus Roizmanbacteria bacterium RIFCSPHIGHO2_12_FULL_42_10]|uniref:ABC transporter permease n=1 Tax=Candidatus Roizmanbacteria bacterium RIFCSPHIGHO2_12_FULL_42_10 TaxID=1802053 RepID=A0A1F7I2T3_9BACT|nr:MAG: hypothetical protein A3F32_02875 [Candidatus Roizmanbacteria bacterium RIFCSPHIGHO2_12_FULL_42_10]